jgi:Na+/H+ antiporter NhaD/arsenite permease-like protein
MLTPLVIEITKSAKRNPLPYLIGLALSANIGSCATIIGNPQNMLIGSLSGIRFSVFLAALAPPSIIGLVVTWFAVSLVFKKEFGRDQRFDIAHTRRGFVYRPLLIKCLIASAGMLVAFACNVDVVLASSVAAAFLLLTRRINPEKIMKEVDFSLLLFFSGLFVLTSCVERSAFFQALLKTVTPFSNGSLLAFSTITTIVSNIISNVPAVLALKSLVSSFPSPDTAWIALAMASTYAGNLTLLGSVANLIVAEKAAGNGIKVSFFSYLKIGLPVTVLTILIGATWIAFMQAW